jgi:septal ring factor EnvC (AmiA/AmiB activator)
LIGNPSRATIKGKKTYYYRYYSCANIGAHGGKVIRHRAEKLEEQVPGILARLRATPAAEQKYAKDSDQARQKIESQIQASEKKLTTLAKRKSHAWDSAAEGGISNAELRERLQAIESEMTDVQAAIQRDRSRLASLLSSERAEEKLQTVFSDLAQLWPTAPEREQRATAKTLAHVVGGLVVTPEGALKTFLGSKQDRLHT